MYEWDPAKSAANRRKHGISFEEVEDALLRGGLIADIDNPGYAGQRLLVFRFQAIIYVAAIEERGERLRLITAHPDRKLRKKIWPLKNGSPPRAI